MIRLFEAGTIDFTNNGIGVLSNAVTCVVAEELNGGFELELMYPITGIHYSELAIQRIIMAAPNHYMQDQPFRIYSISKPINGIVVVNAEHISYDLSGIPVTPALPYYVKNASAAFAFIKANAAVTCPFVFSTDITKEVDLDIPVPRSARSLMSSDEDGILGVYGGQYIFDRYDVKLLEKRGEDRGVSIRYGKNLTDLEQEENCSEVYTGVYPYYYQEDDGLQELPEKIVQAEGTFVRTRVLPLDMTSMFEEMPTQAALREQAVKYMTDNKIGVPKVSLKVSFVSTIGNNGPKELEDVRLGDTVTVVFVALGVNATSECIKTEFDVIRGKYNSVELGEPTSTLSDTIADTIANQNGTNSEVAGLVIRAGKTEQGLEAEVTRATETEGTLFTRITVTENGLVSKVGKAELISEINQSAEAIILKANRLIVESANFTLDGDGNAVFSGTVNVHNADSGTIYSVTIDPQLAAGVDCEIKETDGTTYETLINGAHLNMWVNNNKRLHISAAGYIEIMGTNPVTGVASLNKVLLENVAKTGDLNVTNATTDVRLIKFNNTSTPDLCATSKKYVDDETLKLSNRIAALEKK